MISYYLNKRLRPIAFFLLAVFLVLLVSSDFSWSQYVKRVLMIFVSLLIYRLIDDAGSIRIDRHKHQERIYLNQDHYSSFLAITLIAIVFYYLLLVIVLPELLVKSIAFMLLSICCYLLFQRYEFALECIALMKYPFLVYCFCLMGPSLSAYLLAISSFFIMLSFDLFEKERFRMDSFLSIFLLIIIGALVFQPWNQLVLSIYVLPPIILYYYLRSSRVLQFIPILYFPVIHFINSTIL